MLDRKIIYIIVGLLVVVGSAAATYALLNSSSNKTSSSNDASILNREVLASLPEKSASSANLTRLARDITPPTNSWISGLALQEKPLAVFPMPLSFQASDTGFQVGLPTVTSSVKEISGGHTPGIEATITGAVSFEMTRFDKTSATLTYREGNDEKGKLTIAQGSPYVFYRSVRNSEIVINNAGGGTLDGASYSYEKGGKRYVINGQDGTSLRVDGAKIIASVPAGDLLTVYALPSDKTNDDLKEFAGNEITAVAVTNETQGNQSLTKFEYKTANNNPTIFSPLPYQTLKDGSQADLVFQSIYGDMKTYTGNSFTTTADLVTPSNELDVTKLSSDEKNKLIEDLKTDSKDTAVQPQDSYFAGKQLARIANLLSLAKQLGEDEISSELQADLKSELTKRLDGTYFYYDTELKGIAAQTAAFGSEDFNDHHFHYGYFIYAASILGKYDAEFLKEYKDVINLLVADIASYETYDEFPIQRNYDPYSGHAWAAGLSPFQDGNNQESSSEAINAWNAVAVWGDLIGHATLKQTSQWMLSHEVATAAKAWRNVDTSPSYLSSYTSPVASLSFGGKRTYATFFSDESNTKLAIQLIPMSPVMKTFESDGDEITAKLAAQDQPSNYNVALGDYLIMYLALNNKPAALEALNSQRSEFIDDGNSKAYIRAWIYTQS